MKMQHIFRLLLLILSLAIVAGCVYKAPVPAEQWKEDVGVQKTFEAGTLLADHTYYYLGSIAAPDSIIAINNHFTLRTRVWAQVEDMNEKVLKGWLQMLRYKNTGYCSEYYGGVILTPDGQQAGVWYSPNTINIVQMPEPGVVVVFKPHTVSGAACGDPEDGMQMNGGR